MRRRYPILEFDPSRKALIDPRPRREGKTGAPEHCVFCYFREVVERLARRDDVKAIARWRWADTFILYEMSVKGKRIGVMRPAVGAPVAAGLLDDAIALGCRKFIVCGGAGSLVPGQEIGAICVPTSAVRDEGTSYHYLPPEREARPSPKALAAIKRVLTRHGLDYALGKTWTTDAPLRETPDKIALRRGEGCITVEMEAAAFFAVARFRKVMLAQMLYAGDDVSGEKWDERGWTGKAEVRQGLFDLAVEACLEM